MSIDAARVAEELERATSQAMERLGAEAGLPPLVWRVSGDVGGLSVEAHVPAGAANSEQRAATRAAALGMQENSGELRADVRTWFVNLGTWYVEITTAPSFWETWPKASRVTTA